MTDTPGTPDEARRFRLTTFGTLALAGPDDDTVLGTHGHHRRRLALLAVLAAAGARGRSRDQLLLLFWPDATQERARHSLYQLLYAIRSSIDEGVFAGSNPVRLDPTIVDSDVGAFSAAIERGDFLAATAEYRGPFLDGFYLDDAPEFERWVEEERARIASSHAHAVERLAREADAASDVENSLRWWRRLTELDPLSSTHAMGLIRAFIRAGDHAAAQQFGERYAALVERELDTSVGPAVVALLAEAREASRVEIPVSTGAPVVSLPRAGRVESPVTPAQPRRWYWTGAAVATALVIAVASLMSMSQRASSSAGAAEASSGIPAVPVSTLRRRQPTRNLAANELYERGNDRQLLRNDSTARQGLEYLHQAVALDSNFAAAWAALARMSNRVAGYRTADRIRHLNEAREYARRAVALDDSSAEAHEVLAGTLLFAFRLTEAEQHLNSAIALDPTRARPHEMLVTLDLWKQRPDIALDHARRAVELEPLSAPTRAELAHALIELGRCSDARPTLDSLAGLKPPLLRGAMLLALCHASVSQWPLAIAAMRSGYDGSEASTAGFLGYVLARNGNRDEALHIATQLRDRVNNGESAAFNLALVYFGLSDLEEAFQWLNRSLDDRSLVGGAGIATMPALMGPLFEAERKDPRFAAFLKRLGR